MENGFNKNKNWNIHFGSKKRITVHSVVTVFVVLQQFMKQCVCVCVLHRFCEYYFVSERSSLLPYLSGICLGCGQPCFSGSTGKHFKHRLNLWNKSALFQLNENCFHLWALGLRQTQTRLHITQGSFQRQNGPDAVEITEVLQWTTMHLIAASDLFISLWFILCCNFKKKKIYVINLLHG